MRILWVSSIAWKSNTGYPYPVNGAGAVSGSLFQQSIIEELETIGHTVDIVADYPYMTGSSTHKKIRWEHREGAEDILVNTLDMPYYSIIHKEKELRKAVKEKVSRHKYDLAVAYLIHQPYLSAISYAKKIQPCIKTVLICPDLPDMMDMTIHKKKIKAFLKALDRFRIERLYRQMDGFVLFAEAMKERIPIGKAKYAVVEGCATTDELDIKPVKKEKFIMYAGSLQEKFGVDKIIQAMPFLEDSSVELKIYGTGELEAYVRECGQIDPRVHYCGFVDRKTLFEEQKKALALINARSPDEKYTKYSFPSKTFEYLYSGTPFITTRLEGVPAEYSEYLFEIDSNEPQEIAKMVNRICSMTEKELYQSGLKAREFVAKKKNRHEQTLRVEKFLNELMEKKDT